MAKWPNGQMATLIANGGEIHEIIILRTMEKQKYRNNFWFCKIIDYRIKEKSQLLCSLKVSFQFIWINSTWCLIGQPLRMSNITPPLNLI